MERIALLPDRKKRLDYCLLDISKKGNFLIFEMKENFDAVMAYQEALLKYANGDVQAGIEMMRDARDLFKDDEVKTLVDKVADEMHQYLPPFRKTFAKKIKDLYYHLVH